MTSSSETTVLDTVVPGSPDTTLLVLSEFAALLEVVVTGLEEADTTEFLLLVGLAV